MIPATMEKIPGYLGYLIINEDGGVIASGGELENDEHSAEILFQMVHTTNKRDLISSDYNDGFKRMSIHYPNFVYLVTISNRKVHVVKRKYILHEPVHV